jgi:hypothetical protein
MMICVAATVPTWHILVLTKSDFCTECTDNPDVICTYIKASYLSELRQRNDVESLRSLSFHNVANKFDNVCFGANEYYGINRATPTEVLHSIEKVWYLYALECFYSKIAPAVHDFLNGLATHVSGDSAHQSNCNMPRLKFANGILSFANF